MTADEQPPGDPGTPGLKQSSTDESITSLENLLHTSELAVIDVLKKYATNAPPTSDAVQKTLRNVADNLERAKFVTAHVKESSAAELAQGATGLVAVALELAQVRNELDEAHDTPVANTELQARLRNSDDRARALEIQLEQQQQKQVQAEAEVQALREQLHRHERSLDDRAISRVRLQRTAAEAETERAAMEVERDSTDSDLNRVLAAHQNQAVLHEAQMRELRAELEQARREQAAQEMEMEIKMVPRAELEQVRRELVAREMEMEIKMVPRTELEQVRRERAAQEMEMEVEMVPRTELEQARCQGAELAAQGKELVLEARKWKDDAERKSVELQKQAQKLQEQEHKSVELQQQKQELQKQKQKIVELQQQAAVTQKNAQETIPDPDPAGSFKSLLAGLEWTTAADAVMLAQVQNGSHPIVAEAQKAVDERASLAISQVSDMIDQELDYEKLRLLRIGSLRDLMDAINVRHRALRAELKKKKQPDAAQQGKVALIKWYESCGTQLQAYLKERVEASQTIADGLITSKWMPSLDTFDQIDADGDGKISRNEWLAAQRQAEMATQLQMSDVAVSMHDDLKHRNRESSLRHARSRAGLGEVLMRLAWMESDVHRWRHNLIGGQDAAAMPPKKQVTQLRRLVRTLETENARLWQEVQKSTCNASQSGATAEDEDDQIEPRKLHRIEVENSQLNMLNAELATQLQECHEREAVFEMKEARKAKNVDDDSSSVPKVQENLKTAAKVDDSGGNQKQNKDMPTFDQIDADGDGKISRKEWLAAQRQAELNRELQKLKDQMMHKDKQLLKKDQEIHQLLEDREILRDAALKFDEEKSVQQVTIVECTQAIKQGQRQVHKLSKQLQAAELEATRAVEQRQELLNEHAPLQQSAGREKELVDECGRLTKLLETLLADKAARAFDQIDTNGDSEISRKEWAEAERRQTETQDQMQIQLQAQKGAAARELQAAKNDFRKRWDQALALFKQSTLQESAKHQQAIQKLQLQATRSKVQLEKTTALLLPLKQALLQLNAQLGAPQQPRDWLAEVASTLTKMLQLLEPVNNQAARDIEDQLEQVDAEINKATGPPVQDAQQTYDQAIAQMDRDGDGFVQPAHYSQKSNDAADSDIQQARDQAVAQMDSDIQQARDQAVAQMDRDGDGFVQPAEYEDALKAAYEEAYEEAVQDGEGLVKPAEAAAEAQAAADRFNFDRIDRNGDGFIDRDEYSAAVRVSFWEQQLQASNAQNPEMPAAAALGGAKKSNDAAVSDVQQAYDQAVAQMDRDGDGFVQPAEYDDAAKEAYEEAAQDADRLNFDRIDREEYSAPVRAQNGSGDEVTPTSPKEAEELLNETGALNQMLSSDHARQEEALSESPFVGF